MKRCFFFVILLISFSGIGQQKINVDSIVSSWNLRNETDIDFLADTLTSSFDDDSLKMRAIYFWITDNIAYDIKKLRAVVGGSRYPKKKEMDEDERLYSEIWYTVKKKKGICGDYANLFAYMCKEAHIPCVVIGGNASNSNVLLQLRAPDTKHAWNAVQIHHKWYLLDATWASGYVLFRKKPRFEKARNEFYYLTPPQELIKTHRPYDEKWTMIPYIATFLHRVAWLF
jgi:transglutaminase/protease-like cytokinesis protein 3